MDLSYAHLMTTERIIEILIERQINIANLQFKSRSDLIELYNKLALPLPQRIPRSLPLESTKPPTKTQLKRKIMDCGETPSEGGTIKVVRNGLNDLKIENSLKRTNNDDDPMDGSTPTTKRKPITWP